MTRRDIPNLITLFRLLLVPPLVWALLARRFEGALILFGLAAVSDGLDGFLARRCGWTSRLGAVLDPLGDKVLLVSVYLALGVVGFLPVWLVALVMGRDLMILGGAGLFRLLFGWLEIRPTGLSKLNTLLQILLALACIGAFGLQWIPEAAIGPLVWLVAASTAASGAQYLLIWGWRARVERRGGGGPARERGA